MVKGVKEEDLQARGRRFKSLHWILDGMKVYLALKKKIKVLKRGTQNKYIFFCNLISIDL